MKKKNPARRLAIIGASIIALTSLALAITIHSFYSQNIADEEPEFENYSEQDQEFKQLESAESEKNVISVPERESASGAPVIDPEIESGIPTGTYSNPPTSVTPPGSSSGLEGGSASGNRLTELGSSVELNRARQGQSSQGSSAINPETTTPDYSSPSPSNNFNSGASADNSLVEPLEDGSLEDSSTLEIPASNDSEPASITPPPIGGSNLQGSF